jgi:DNA-binding HxlR family transcriptional regulator
MAVITHPAGTPTVFDAYAASCPSRRLLTLVTSRWAVLAVGALEDGPARFGELRRRLDGISSKVLADKLRQLEDEDLVERVVVDRPLAVTYALTDIGRSLVDHLTGLRRWAEAHCDAR